MTCESCRGEGTVTHSLCGGDGRLCAWDVVTYRYFTETRRVATTLPSGSPIDELHADRWRYRGQEPLAELDADTLAAWVGQDSAALRRVLAEAREAADSVRREMAPGDDAAGGSGMSARQAVSVTATYDVVPVSAYAYARGVNRADRGFWLVGSGADAIEVPWEAGPDFAMRWALVYGLITAGTTLIPLVSTPVLAAYAGFVAWSILSVEGAAREMAAALRLAVTRPRRVRTIALLGEPRIVSLYASCLASVGSHARLLEVLGPRARQQVERLIDVGADTGHQAPLVAKLQDGRRVRLIGLETPQTEAAWSALRRSVDGFVCVDSANSSLADSRGPGSESLEDIRRRYVGNIGDHAAWRATFHELWAPIERALDTRRDLSEEVPRRLERVA